MINFFLINVPFPLVDMSAWQRIVASKNASIARLGLFVAIITFIITWSAILFGAIALTEYSSADKAGGLPTLLIMFGETTGTIGIIISAVCFAALIAAMLSTADTFLVAAGQTISMDITDTNYFKEHPIEEVADEEIEEQYIPMGLDDKKVVDGARKKMALMAFAGLVFCIILIKIGFGVAELVFAVYGSSLALFPAIGFALLRCGKSDLSQYGVTATTSVILGFVSGWSYGIISVAFPAGSQNIFARALKFVDFLPGDPSVYNSPTIAFSVSCTVMLLGLLINAIRSKLR